MLRETVWVPSSCTGVELTTFPCGKSASANRNSPSKFPACVAAWTSPYAEEAEKVTERVALP